MGFSLTRIEFAYALNHQGIIYEYINVFFKFWFAYTNKKKKKLRQIIIIDIMALFILLLHI